MAKKSLVTEQIEKKICKTNQIRKILARSKLSLKACEDLTIMELKVTPDLRGCPRGKNSHAHHFKGKHGKLYIVGKLNKCRFWKKI